jgi:hypothetical protein
MRQVSNPVIEALIHARVADIVDPPRSWNAQMKQVFLTLPPHVQVFLAARDRERDREVRRCQNDRTAALKLLAKTEDERDRALAKLKELENGIIENEVTT